MSAALPRPSDTLLRQPLQKYLKKHIFVAIAASALSGIAWYQIVCKSRRENYERFHKTWDQERHYRRMVQADVFQNVKADQAPPAWLEDYEKEVDQAIKALKK